MRHFIQSLLSTTPLSLLDNRVSVFIFTVKARGPVYDPHAALFVGGFTVRKRFISLGRRTNAYASRHLQPDTKRRNVPSFCQMVSKLRTSDVQITCLEAFVRGAK